MSEPDQDDFTGEKRSIPTPPPPSPPPASSPPPTPPSASRCFIATAAYGSELSPPVQFLREFRDNIVLRSKFKKPFEIFLEQYYQHSPQIANQMRKHKTLKFTMKYLVVWPFVGITYVCASLINFLQNKSFKRKI